MLLFVSISTINVWPGNEPDILQTDLLRKPNLIAAVEDNSLPLRRSALILPALEQPLAAKMKLKCGDYRRVKLLRLSVARRTRWRHTISSSECAPMINFP